MEKQQVRDESRPGGDVSAESIEVVRREAQPPDEQRSREHERKSGEDPTDASGVKLGEREGTVLELSQDDPGDQEARDDKKEVDPGEAARKGFRKGVKSKDCDNSDGAKAINIRSVSLCHVRALSPPSTGL